MEFFAFSKLCLVILSMIFSFHPVSGIGVNWGSQSTHNLPPDIVVKMLKDNGFQKVKLFDADYGTLKALGNSGIEVMVGIPNDMLTALGSLKAAEKWVSNNISVHLSDNDVNIRRWHFNEALMRRTNLQNMTIDLMHVGFRTI